VSGVRPVQQLLRTNDRRARVQQTLGLARRVLDEPVRLGEPGDRDAFLAGEPAAVGRVEEGLDRLALPCDEEDGGEEDGEEGEEDEGAASVYGWTAAAAVVVVVAGSESVQDGCRSRIAVGTGRVKGFEGDKGRSSVVVVIRSSRRHRKRDVDQKRTPPGPPKLMCRNRS
jgi:hypothetical protein